MKSATLKVTLNIVGVANESCRLAAMPYWFDHIELRTQNGSKHIGIIRADQLMFNLNLLSADQLEGVLDNANMDSDWNPKWEHEANRTVSFYLPLVGTWFDQEHYWQNIQGDVVVDFIPSSDIKILTNADCTVDCAGMSLIIETENLTQQDEVSHQAYHSQVISSTRVLDWVPVDEYSKVLTAGSTSTIDLDSVVGSCAGFVVLIRDAGATNDNNGRFEYKDLGDGAQIDFVTSGGKSVLGSGVPLDGSYLKNEVWAKHFNSNFNKRKNCYFIPFTENMKRSNHGVVDGIVSLNGSGHKLQLKPASAGSATVQILTVVGGTVPDCGLYRFSYRGENSEMLAFDNNIATMKAALERMRSFLNFEGGALSVTCVNTVDVGTAITLTFPAGVKVEDKVYINSVGLLDGTVQCGYDTSSSQEDTSGATQAESGFTSGTYDVSTYALVYQNQHTQNGKTAAELF